jgi:cyclophilin family peptidyl-prolyl cis-trans isomerase/HEAT repeat protein
MTQKSIFILTILIITISFNCKNSEDKNDKFINYADGNIFTDKSFEEIAKLQYNRDSKQLIEKIQTEYIKNPIYLERAILAFGSIQDTLVVTLLSEYFSHEKEKVRIATAFSLGQTKCLESEKTLAKAFLSEKENNVKIEILKSLGKTGGTETLNFIIKSIKNDEKDELLTGKIQAIAILAERGIVDENIRDEVFNIILNEKINEEIKYWCTYYLFRSKQNYENYSEDLEKIYNKLNSVFAKSNILKTFAGIQKPEVFEFLNSIISKPENDYRLRINAIKAIKAFDYFENEKNMLKLLSDKNISVAIAAAEFFIEKGKEEKADLYFETAKNITLWNIRTKMLTASLKYAKDKTKISDEIKSGFEATGNIYEKSALLEALAFDFNNFEYLKTTAFETEQEILSTASVSAISEMRYSPNFNVYSKKNKSKNTKIEAEFAEFFKKAILSGDIAMMSVAASTIRDENFNYRELYENTYFVKQAMNKCILPRDIEAYLELVKTNEYLNGKDPSFVMPETEFKTPDFEFIKCIPPNQKVEFITNAGTFVMQLNVNETPVSVGTFLELVKSGFYEGKKIHRVVADFVIQDGCPRGDGWGSPGFSIRSEFWPAEYSEGSIGLASAGKDTESSQWFVTHSPTPHLNGRYTIIGNVVEGMETIHKIQIGDSIISLKIL